MAAKDRLAEFQNVKPVNLLFYSWVVVPLRALILKYFRIKVIGREEVPYNKPALVLANHVALLDPIWVYAGARGSLHPVATEDLFRRPILNKLVHWCGAFPKRKAARDFSAMKNTIRLLRKGLPVGIFPEGIRTWDGKPLPLAPGIATLIQRMKVPVIGCRQDGSYVAHPRWARRMRRFPITLTYRKIYDAETIPGDPQQIIRDIESFINADDYQLDVDEQKYRRSGLAVDVTRLLYRCPNCQTLEGLKIVRPHSTNKVECTSCYSSWRVTAANNLVPLDECGRPIGEKIPLWQAYRRFKDFPLVPLSLSNPLTLEPGETVYLRSRTHVLGREERFPRIRALAAGKFYLTNRRLVFRNRHRLVLDARLRDLSALSTEAGNRFNFVYRSRIYNVTMRNESILKWFDTIHRLIDAERQAPV